MYSGKTYGNIPVIYKIFFFKQFAYNTGNISLSRQTQLVLSNFYEQWLKILKNESGYPRKLYIFVF